MIKRKLLTIDDLVEFCKNHNFAKFNSKESGYQLAVQVPTTFEIDETNENNHRGMMRLKFRILHDGLNRNGSFVSKEAADKAASTISDRPILAAIHKLDDGTYDFESHEMEIVENENGEQEINYIEKQVGSFSSEPPFWEYDEELDKNYLCAYGYIAEEYTKAPDIIRAKNGTKNSCELTIEELSYNAKEKYLDLQSFYLSASTLLGSRDDGTEIGEGMLGSRADIANFSTKNNSIQSKLNDEIKEFIRETVKESFEDIVTNNTVETKKGGVDMADFDENVEVTETEEVEETSTEESAEEVTVTEEEKAEEVTPDEEETVEDEKSEEFEEKTEEESEQNFVKMSVDINGSVKNFSVSLADKLNALYTLVNDTYAESDNDWYEVDGFDDEKYVLMHGWFSGKHYKQSYSVKKDVYSLKGDRVEVYATYLTEDEQKQLESMKSNYSSISEKLQKYEEEPDKLAILQSDEYSDIAESEEFKQFCKRESYFEMSVEDVKAKADSMLLEAAKAHKVDFSTKDNKKSVEMKKLPIMNKSGKSGRYGGLFSKK